MRISDNCIFLEQDEIPAGITLQGMADFLAPHFGGDNAMHHYMIREVSDRVILYYTPETTEAIGSSGPFCCLNGWGSGEELFFEADDQNGLDGKVSGTGEATGPSVQKRTPTNVLQLVNLLRAERGLPRVRRGPKPGQITRQIVREICTQVWQEKYPRALTDENFVLGELTAKLVEQEVERRIAILKGQLIPLKR